MFQKKIYLKNLYDVSTSPVATEFFTGSLTVPGAYKCEIISWA